MLRSNTFSKLTAYIGIVASVLLFFAGDIATAVFSSSSVIALFIAIGYMFWMVWFPTCFSKTLSAGKELIGRQGGMKMKSSSPQQTE